MKNKSVILKILCGALCVCITAFCSFALVGCGSCSSKGDSASTSDGDDSSTTEISVSLDKRTLTLAEWDSATLVAEVTGTDKAVVWSSADGSIATVENGKITALSVGETTITAAIGEVSDSCKVIVEATSVEPVIEIDELDAERKLIVRDVGSFTLHARVLWNGAAVDDAVFFWKADDEQIVAVTGNGYEASVSGLKEGETAVRATATVRGKTAVYVFDVKVNPEGALLKTDDEKYAPNDGGYKVTINAVEENEGDKTNVSALNFYASYKGETIKNPSIVWTTENDDIIELDAATGKITAKQGGSALINGVWHYDVTDKDYSVKVNVEVARVNVAVSEVKNVVVNRADALQLTLSNETVQSYEVEGKSFTDGFNVDGTVAKFNGANFDVNNQTNTIKVKIITDKRVYSMTANSYYAIASVDEWKSVWNPTTAIKVFSKASVVKIENDIDVSGYSHGNINNTASGVTFSGVFDGQGHTITGATAGFGGLFAPVSADGVIKNVAFVGIKLLKETTLFYNTFGGTIENCYFEGYVSRTDSNATPAFTCTLGRTAVIRNVVMNIRGRGVNAKNAEQKAIFRYYGTGEGQPAISGLYASVDVSDGVASYEDTINGSINLYSSAAAMNAALTALPEKFSSDLWQISDGILSFKSSEKVLKDYINANKLQITALSSVNKEVETTLTANKDCVWSVEGLEESAYTLDGNALTLSSSAPTGETFAIVATYTDQRFGYVYTERMTDVLIKNKPAAVKTFDEKTIVGLNRTTATYAFTLDEAAEILAVTVGGAATEEFATDGNVIKINAAAFTAAGDTEISIETEKIVYKAIAEVFDMAIGTLDEFKTFWSRTSLPADKTVTLKVAFTADIDASSYSFNGGTVVSNYTFNGVIDGKGHTVKGAQSTYYGMFYCLGANAVIKDIAFTGIRFYRDSSIVSDILSGRIENCYFEGSGGSAADNNALAKRIGNTAVIKNVVVYLHDRPSGTEAQIGVFNGLTNGGTGAATAPSGVYVINTSSNGQICDKPGNTDLSGISLYSSLAEFKAANATRPDDISERYWNYLAAL